MTTLMTHEKLEARRNILRSERPADHLALKNKRYAFFRVQNFLEGGSAPEAEHITAVKAVEDEIVSLGGVNGFAKRWDFDPLTGKVVGRDKSIWDAHEEFMKNAAPEINSKAAAYAESLNREAS